MGGRLIRQSACAEYRLGGPPVSLRALSRAHGLENRRAHDRVHELERVFTAEEIDSDERARRTQRGLHLDLCQRGGQRELSAITKDRGGT